MKHPSTLVLLLTFCCLAASSPAEDGAAELLFVRRIAPLFHEKCLACHGDDEKKIKSGFDMRTRAGVLKGRRERTGGGGAGTGRPQPAAAFHFAEKR